MSQLKLIIIGTLCLIIQVHALAQDHFEQKVKGMGGFEFYTLMAEGQAKFDFKKMSNKTIVFPDYSAESIYQKLDLNDTYKKKANQSEKSAFYKKIHYEAIDESSYDKSLYTHENIKYSSLSRDERKNYLFLSYYETMNYYYVVLWFVGKNYKEYPISMTLVNDLDLAKKEDLRLMFNILDQGIQVFEDGVNKKMYEALSKAGKDDSKPIEERLISLNSNEVQESVNEYNKKLVLNYLSESKSKTLIIPERYKTKALEKVMQNWKYSNFTYLSEADIDEKRKNKNPHYSYIRIQVAGKGMMASSNLWILSTDNDRMLYAYSKSFSSSEKLSKIIPRLIEDIEHKESKYDKSSTLCYLPVDFEKGGLPSDIKTSKIVYVNLTKTQYAYADWINKSFERKMKRYNYDYKITDKANDVSGCKYRVKLKSSLKSYKRITTEYEEGRGVDVDTDYITKELFYLYLENLETGKCYKFQVNPNFYPYTFKDFVKQVNNEL